MIFHSKKISRQINRQESGGIYCYGEKRRKHLFEKRWKVGGEIYKRKESEW